ncbi:DNA polymerase III subunit delta' [Metallumcola ferriviriculae]|uniref:DNA polymerase III subunit delta n=1 Tax=Metallumcola ferriviriculae TaxID=3039180 RepID=A0AAU0UIB4_9FIRM|nr:DNA polymerase III subunit delta' [Desulfitibacteraceae bacterium MK1]
MSIFEPIDTHIDVWNKLKKAITAGRMAHAYIFQGAEGSGRESVARAFAATVNCLNPDHDGTACGQCVSCRKIHHNNHPNIYYIEPDGASIKLHQFKELKRELSLRQVENGCQVIIIRQAEKMTGEAANSILKILEEPPAQTVFILIVKNISAIKTTILSRCQKVSFQTASLEDTYKLLIEETGYSMSEVKLAMQIGGEGVERARQLLEGKLFELRGKVLDKVKRVDSMHQAELMTVAEEWSGEFAWEIIQVLILWYRDLLVWREAGTDNLIINMDRMEQIKQDTTPDGDMRGIIDIILEAQWALSVNANKKLTMQDMLLKWSKVYR